ncbi:protein trichome birefringence-like 26 [Dioscorea cayenensis subsp. rotundata]|uniref:Protein trichome birefringence-like 26 n=1 Tax=Dioscorea cayennensis subsp. rotundata TaxID=55577 RepID=A0AB40B4J1_DIOCR|nr:protein trichome birefringence-like 26 [Dioscorea cayenensis subsp. rotundata]
MADEKVMMGREPLIEHEKTKSIKQILLKSIAGVLLVGFACYLFLDSFTSLTPETEINSLPLEKAVNEQHPKKEVCDVSTGEWIPNPSGPIYTNATCNHIQNHQNCMKNGRPDTGYLYWRWKPSNCDLPPFDPVKFLNKMRDKSWVFIGDSIFRNHFQSLTCMLSKVEELVETYHDSAYRCQTLFSPNYNFTLAVIWAPYLVQYESIDSETLNIHLDILDSKWSSEYNKYDYVVISGGQWFYRSAIMYENNKAVGCHNCPYENLRELGVVEPYRKALQLTLNFMARAEHKPFVIFRTWTPDHFEYGKWYNGGICNRTEPFKEGEINGYPVDLVMRNTEVEEFGKAAAIGERNGVRMELLDTYHLSLLRPDGHPGPYRTYHPFDGDKKKKVQNDCLHWCLPGPIDTWNELLMKMVINGDDHDSISALS